MTIAAFSCWITDVASETFEVLVHDLQQRTRKTVLHTSHVFKGNRRLLWRTNGRKDDVKPSRTLSSLSTTAAVSHTSSRHDCLWTRSCEKSRVSSETLMKSAESRNLRFIRGENSDLGRFIDSEVHQSRKTKWLGDKRYELQNLRLWLRTGSTRRLVSHMVLSTPPRFCQS